MCKQGVEMGKRGYLEPGISKTAILYPWERVRTSLYTTIALTCVF